MLFLRTMHLQIMTPLNEEGKNLFSPSMPSMKYTLWKMWWRLFTQGQRMRSNLAILFNFGWGIFTGFSQCRYLVRSRFYLGLFVWGQKKNLRHAAARKNFLKTSKGSGGMLPLKMLKIWCSGLPEIAVLDISNLHWFPKIVVKKDLIWNIFIFFRNFFFFWGGGGGGSFYPSSQ